MLRPNVVARWLTVIVWSGALVLMAGCNKSEDTSKPLPKQVVGVQPAKPPSAYVWEPNPTWLPQLTQTADLGDYRVSLMKDFAPIEIQRKLPANMKVFSWHGVPEDGKLPPVVNFTIWKDDKMLAEAKNMRKMLINFTAGTTDSAGITTTKPGALEKGTIGGIEFSQAKWIGQTSDRVEVKGMTYGAIDGPNVIAIIAMSFGKDAEQANHLLASMIATLKKK